MPRRPDREETNVRKPNRLDLVVGGRRRSSPPSTAAQGVPISLWVAAGGRDRPSLFAAEHCGPRRADPVVGVAAGGRC